MKNCTKILSLVFISFSVTSFSQGISMGGGDALGANSLAFGINSTAEDTASIAGGINAIASKIASLSLGEGTHANGDYSISMGQGTYAGALGSVVMGAYSHNQGQHSVSFGLNNVITSNSYYASNIGAGNFVDNWGAIAVGRDNRVLGGSGVGMGQQNYSLSFGEVVLGSYSDTTGYTGFNRYGWQANDRLFVLGNGYSHATRSNALVVLKTGDASFQGGLTVGSLETAIDASTDTKLVVYGGSVLSDVSDLAEQVLIGTGERNLEAKLYLQNSGYPYAMKIEGKGSTSGTALFVEGGLNVDGTTILDGNLTVTGSLAKGAGTFKIDHPLDPQNKYLYHSFVESPDMMNVYNGNVITDETGTASIELPNYFEALNKDFRYQLTPIGQFSQAIVFKKIEGNQFVIKTDKPHVEVSWQVTGIRNDAYAQKNRVKVSVDKSDSEKGTYMHPEAFAADQL